LHTLEVETWVPRTREEVFRFFADPRNLEVLTPPWLRFRVLTPDVDMRRGVRIDYRLRLRYVPLRWQSEITLWDPPRRFIDEQRRGPYRTWRHEHSFLEERGGTLVRDRIEYEAPGGELVERLLVRPDIERIFEFRRRKLGELFGTR